MSDSHNYPTDPPRADELRDAAVGLLAPDTLDPVVEVYKKGVDRTILRENLKLSPQERSEKFVAFMKSVWQLREIAERTRRNH